MDGAKISILEQVGHVRLRSLLNSQNRLTLEPQVSIGLVSDLPDDPLEWILGQD